MKALKQQLEQNCITRENVAKFQWVNDSWLTLEQAITTVREWLEQKRQETTEKTKGLGLHAYYETTTKELDELLEELKQ